MRMEGSNNAADFVLDYWQRRSAATVESGLKAKVGALESPDTFPLHSQIGDSMMIVLTVREKRISKSISKKT